MEIRVLTVGVVETNCYLVWDTNHAGFIVDPGDQKEDILKAVKEENISVKAILLTHGHFDHFLAAEELKKETNACIIAPEKELMLLSDPKMNLSETLVYKPAVLTADQTVKEGEVLTIGDIALKVMETPGHTIGSVCYYIEDEKVLFSGDTLFKNSIGRTDFPTGDFRQLVRSIKGKLFALPEDTTVFSGHGEITTIGCEK